MLRQPRRAAECAASSSRYPQDSQKPSMLSFRRAPRTMESHFSSYALMQLSSPHTHSPSPNTPPNLLLFILDLRSAGKLESERSVTSGDRHACQICDLSRGRHPPFLNFMRESRGMPYTVCRAVPRTPTRLHVSDLLHTADMMSLTHIFLNHL